MHDHYSPHVAIDMPSVFRQEVHNGERPDIDQETSQRTPIKSINPKFSRQYRKENRGGEPSSKAQGTHNDPDGNAAEAKATVGNGRGVYERD